MPKQTPSQTVGPFFAYAMTPEPYGRQGIAGHVLAGPDTLGERIRITGRVLDGAGAGVPDAVVEIWQANAAGRYRHPEDDRDALALDPAFRGFGRAGTGADGGYEFVTVKPGALGDGQAPHVNVIVCARGMLSHAFTRLYFDDESAANAGDRVLTSVPDARRGTLLAAREASAAGVAYRFDIRLQGDGETVFFDA